MKKHVFGLLIFGFIVSAAAIFYGVFSFGWTYKLPSAPKLKGERIANSSTISQPTLNTTTSDFIFETDCAENSKGILLYFYEKIGNETRQIVIQHVSTKDLELCRDNAVTKKIFWTSKINVKGNLYVVAYADDSEEASANFNESRAMPVLISSDKSETVK